jgi:hypothetical protein
MAAPKYKSSDLEKLYQEKESQNLNDKIQKDLGVSKKAALILEQWLKSKARP